MNETYDVILKRRSVRKYQDREVSKENITTLLEAAMAAPTACNNQPWEFVVVTDTVKLSGLKDKLKFANYNAPAAIVVCGNLKLARGGMENYWVQDCSAAMENILLTATSLGLGGIWIGVHPLPSVIKPVKKALNIPEYVVPLGIAYIGYPAEEKESRTQYNEKRVYWEEYEKSRKHKARPKNTKYL